MSKRDLVFFYDCYEDLPEELRGEHTSESMVEEIVEALGGTFDVNAVRVEAGRLPRMEGRGAWAFPYVEGPMLYEDRMCLPTAYVALMGYRVLGSGPASVGVCGDKAWVKDIVGNAGVRVPDTFLVSGAEDCKAYGGQWPCFVKPNGEGSGLGIDGESVCRNMEELEEKVERELEMWGQLLVEPFYRGPHYTVALMGNGRGLRAYGPMEIAVDKSVDGGVYGHRAKELALEGSELIDVKLYGELSVEQVEKMQDMSKRAFGALRMRDIGRVDLMVDEDGVPVFLEMAAHPGLRKPVGGRKYSNWPLVCMLEGMGYEECLVGFIEAGMERAA